MASIALPRTEARASGGILSWLTTVDHKKIGILYLYTTFFFFLVGGIFASVVVFTVFIIVLLARPEGLAGATLQRRV